MVLGGDESSRIGERCAIEFPETLHPQEIAPNVGQLDGTMIVLPVEGRRGIVETLRERVALASETELEIHPGRAPKRDASRNEFMSPPESPRLAIGNTEAEGFALSLTTEGDGSPWSGTRRALPWDSGSGVRLGAIQRWWPWKMLLC